MVYSKKPMTVTNHSLEFTSKVKCILSSASYVKIIHLYVHLLFQNWDNNIWS